mmetsp:Transcript_33809/g.89613  ORF Transcript_33809/g.89613 Transcript_33809/m.89613 type:complete len:208 (+) Transcript_33809:223-846(+)
MPSWSFSNSEASMPRSTSFSRNLSASNLHRSKVSLRARMRSRYSSICFRLPASLNLSTKPMCSRSSSSNLLRSCLNLCSMLSRSDRSSFSRMFMRLSMECTHCAESTMALKSFGSSGCSQSKSICCQARMSVNSSTYSFIVAPRNCSRVCSRSTSSPAPVGFLFRFWTMLSKLLQSFSLRSKFAATTLSRRMVLHSLTLAWSVSFSS